MKVGVKKSYWKTGDVLTTHSEKTTYTRGMSQLFVYKQNFGTTELTPLVATLTLYLSVTSHCSP